VAGRVRGRVRRRPLLIGVLAVGVLGALAIFALSARPSAEPSVTIGLERAYAGTTYAFDGAICLGSPQVASQVRAVEVEQAPGSTTALVRPPDEPPSVGFPVAGDGEDVAGYRLPAGEDDCTLRVLVTPEQQGTVQAGTLRITMSYGPFGLLRRTAEVQPLLTLDVTGTGQDPRASRDGQ
jgi:hypothetical protein